MTKGGADLAELGSVAGRAKQEVGGTADDGGPHKGRVDGLRHTCIRDALGHRAFFCRRGFAGQQALVDEKISGFKHPAVGWHHVPCGEHDNITGDELIGADRDLFVIAQDPLLERHRDFELFCGLFSTILLDAVG